ncbi:hypothetical protein Aduo_017188 [Ancylostoma duodenale]
MLMKQGAVSKVNDDQTSSEGFKAPLSATSTVKQEVDGLATQKEADLSTTSMIELAASSSKKLQASDIFYNVVPTTSPLAQEKEVVWTRKLTKTVTSNVPKRTKKKKSPKGKQVVVTRTSEEKEDFVTEEFAMVLHFGVPIMLAVLLFTQLHLFCLLRWLKSNYVLIPRSEVEAEEPDIIDDHEMPKEATPSSSKERTYTPAVDEIRSSVGYSVVSGLTATSPNLP